MSKEPPQCIIVCAMGCVELDRSRFPITILALSSMCQTGVSAVQNIPFPPYKVMIIHAIVVRSHTMRSWEYHA